MRVPLSNKSVTNCVNRPICTGFIHSIDGALRRTIIDRIHILTWRVKSCNRRRLWDVLNPSETSMRCSNLRTQLTIGQMRTKSRWIATGGDGACACICTWRTMKMFEVKSIGNWIWMSDGGWGERESISVWVDDCGSSPLFQVKRAGWRAVRLAGTRRTRTRTITPTQSQSQRLVNEQIGPY